MRESNNNFDEDLLLKEFFDEVSEVERDNEVISLLTNGNEVAGADRTSFVPSHVLLGISQETTSSKPTILLSPLGEACSRMDLTAIHEILEKTGYKDDEGIANDVSNPYLL
ncbi:hypothetical protein V6N13_043187 [Hibiscus sabdariffa]|uniref:Serine/threonine-protein kinase BSK1-like TPR repeats domain-containing protein n=1 Tax=Hibiscus sabdariffa TaxID=183260 RepID=A0ABR2G2D6_9ROSI